MLAGQANAGPGEKIKDVSRASADMACRKRNGRTSGMLRQGRLMPEILTVCRLFRRRNSRMRSRGSVLYHGVRLSLDKLHWFSRVDFIDVYLLIAGKPGEEGHARQASRVLLQETPLRPQLIHCPGCRRGGRHPIVMSAPAECLQWPTFRMQDICKWLDVASDAR